VTAAGQPAPAWASPGCARVRHEWTAARQHLDAALNTFRSIGDRPAEARALRELGILLRDQGELGSSGQALNASQEIFAELGDALWTGRVLVCKAALEDLRGADSAHLLRQAADIYRQHGIITEKHITSALREW
jgi:tetratricopeptide (TPR) repeat protein